MIILTISDDRPTDRPTYDRWTTDLRPMNDRVTTDLNLCVINKCSSKNHYVIDTWQYFRESGSRSSFTYEPYEATERWTRPFQLVSGFPWRRPAELFLPAVNGSNWYFNPLLFQLRLQIEKWYFVVLLDLGIDEVKESAAFLALPSRPRFPRDAPSLLVGLQKVRNPRFRHIVAFCS